MPDYSGKKITEASFALIVHGSDIHVTDKEKAASLFKHDDPQAYFYELLKGACTYYIGKKTDIKVARYYRLTDRSLLHKKELVIKDKMLSMDLPEDGYSIKEIKADYILFMENIYATIKKIYWGNDAVPTFVTEAEYAIWSNAKGELVSYGLINAKSPSPFDNKIEEIREDICESIIYEIFKKSPFKINFDRVFIDPGSINTGRERAIIQRIR